MGYATKLIKLLQHAYDKIWTDYSLDILNSPSTKLLLKEGFKIEEALSKNKPGKLKWTKK